ncbi:hypothetical protein IWW50_003376, partial [Coemansia erecta]
MNVHEKQRFYQQGHGPTYLRTPISRFMFKGTIGLLVVGGVYGTYNLGRLIAGVGPAKITPSSGEQIFVYIDVVRTEKVEVAREKAAKALEEACKKPYPTDRLSLIYTGKQLADGMCLFDYGVKHGATFLTHLKLKPTQPLPDADDATVVDRGSSGSPVSIAMMDSPIRAATPLNEINAASIDDALKAAVAVGDSAMAGDGAPVEEIKCDHCDNTSSSTCKHCGCYYCGLKDDEHHTLACDECGLFFHMRCMPEPMTTIPEGDWYCEFCKNDPNTVVAGEKKLNLAGTRRSKMPSAKQTKQWGGGMACAGTTKTCDIVPKDHIGSIPGVHVGQS